MEARQVPSKPLTTHQSQISTLHKKHIILHNPLPSASIVQQDLLTGQVLKSLHLIDKLALHKVQQIIRL